MRRSIGVPLVTLGLLATALAGCLNNPDPNVELPADLVSRVYTVTLDDQHLEKMRAAGNAKDALRAVATTELVVRVKLPGDYSLEYTDDEGVVQTKALPSLVPGVPTTVGHADPLAPTRLLHGNDVSFSRGEKNVSWFHAGDLPLGFTAESGAKATYQFSYRLDDVFATTNVKATDPPVEITQASVEAHVPIAGHASYEVIVEDGALRVPLTLDYAVAGAPAPLFVAQVAGSQDGEAGDAGVQVSSVAASVHAGMTFWFRDGQPAATRFDGYGASASPTITMWQTGGFAKLGGPCAGKTAADACDPTEGKAATNTSQPAGERTEVQEGDLLHATTDDEREAIALLTRAFQQDLVRGDKATIEQIADSGSSPDDQWSTRNTFTIEVVGAEPVIVPAGTFDSVKIVQSFVTSTKVGKLTQRTYDYQNVTHKQCTYPTPGGNETYDCPEPSYTTDTMVHDLDIEQTVAKQTFWLDASTYVPLKMQADLPLDAQAVLHAATEAISPKYWDAMHLKPVSSNDVHMTLTAHASYEATQLQPGVTAAGFTGLTAALMLASGSGSFAYTGISGLGRSSYGVAQPVPAPPCYQEEPATTTTTTTMPVPTDDPTPASPTTAPTRASYPDGAYSCAYPTPAPTYPEPAKCAPPTYAANTSDQPQPYPEPYPCYGMYPQPSTPPPPDSCTYDPDTGAWTCTGSSTESSPPTPVATTEPTPATTTEAAPTAP